MRMSSRIPGWMVAASITSIGGLLNGYDTGSIGAVTTMPYFEKTFGVLSPAIRGFTVSLIMLTGAFPAFFAGRLADRYGHLRVVMVGALTFTLGATLQAGATKIPMFLVGRALGGLGEGLWLSNVSVYICEIAPSNRRGMLVSMPQLMAATGVCVGYFTCYGSVRITSSLSWRLPFIIQGVVAIILAFSCCFLPTSPRWLFVHGRRQEAMYEIARLDISEVEVEKDILRPSGPAEPRPPTAKAFLSIFQRHYRFRTILGLFVLGMVQLCGIDGVLYYAPIIFAQAGLPNGTASFLASGVSAILMLAVSIPAFLYADSWGRRTSVITGGTGLTVCMFSVGCLYVTSSVHAHAGAGRWLVIVLIFAFALFYVATWGVVGKIYASEIQPAQTRAAASSVAQGLGFFTNWLVAFTTPIFLARSSYGAYFLFGGLSLFTVLALALFMPETKGQSLESIQDGFHSPAGKTIRRVRKLLGGPRLRGSRPEDTISATTTTMSGARELAGVTSSSAAITPQRIELGIV